MVSDMIVMMMIDDDDALIVYAEERLGVIKKNSLMNATRRSPVSVSCENPMKKLLEHVSVTH